MPLMNWVEHEKEYQLGEHKLPYHFASNGHDGWIVDFTNQLFQNIFDISLVMLENENVREFPIAYSEKKTYSTIANAIGRLTPYHVSEMYLAKNKNNSKRHVDFWCRCINGQGKIRDIWIECKDIWFNLINKTIDDGFIEEIPSAIKQIESIKIEGNTDRERFKIAFFNVYVYYEVGNNLRPLNFHNDIYKNIEKQISKKKDKRFVVYSALDLRLTIQKEDGCLEDLEECNPYQIFLKPSIYHNDRKEHFMPFMLLIAVIDHF